MAKKQCFFMFAPATPRTPDIRRVLFVALARVSGDQCWTSPRAFTKTIKWVSSFPWARLGKRPVSHQAIWRQEPRLSRRSQQVLIKQLSRRLLIQHHLKFIADHMSFPLHLPVLGIGDVFSAKRIMSGCFTSIYLLPQDMTKMSSKMLGDILGDMHAEITRV